MGLPNKVKREKEKRSNSRLRRRPLRRFLNYPLIHVCRPGPIFIRSVRHGLPHVRQFQKQKKTPLPSGIGQEDSDTARVSAFPRFMSSLPQALVWTVRGIWSSAGPAGKTSTCRLLFSGSFLGTRQTASGQCGSGPLYGPTRS